jgi:hypothetical protein
MSDLGSLMFRMTSLAHALGLVTSRPAKAYSEVSYSTSGTFDVNSTTGSTIVLNKGKFTIELFCGYAMTDLRLRGDRLGVLLLGMLVQFSRGYAVTDLMFCFWGCWFSFRHPCRGKV